MSASHSPRRSVGPPGNARGGGRPAPEVPSAQLARAELATVTAGLQELAQRLDRFRDRLHALEAAVQSSPRATSRSSRESRSSKRSRSS
jgi:hypothetical protein